MGFMLKIKACRLFAVLCLFFASTFCFAEKQFVIRMEVKDASSAVDIAKLNQLVLDVENFFNDNQIGINVKNKRNILLKCNFSVASNFLSMVLSGEIENSEASPVVRMCGVSVAMTPLSHIQYLLVDILETLLNEKMIQVFTERFSMAGKSEKDHIGINPFVLKPSSELDVLEYPGKFSFPALFLSYSKKHLFNITVDSLGVPVVIEVKRKMRNMEDIAFSGSLVNYLKEFRFDTGSCEKDVKWHKFEIAFTI